MVPQLTKLTFKRDDGATLVSIRGKTSGAFKGGGSFQWTAAVKGLALLMIRGVLADVTTSRTMSATLSGCGGTLASSLDYALSKEPAWMLDAFGTDIAGRCYLRRMILRTNSERRYPGPVTISLNHSVIKGESIEIFHENAPINTTESLLKLSEILVD